MLLYNFNHIRCHVSTVYPAYKLSFDFSLFEKRGALWKLLGFQLMKSWCAIRSKPFSAQNCRYRLTIVLVRLCSNTVVLWHYHFAMPNLCRRTDVVSVLTNIEPLHWMAIWTWKYIAHIHSQMVTACWTFAFTGDQSGSQSILVQSRISLGRQNNVVPIGLGDTSSLEYMTKGGAAILKLYSDPALILKCHVRSLRTTISFWMCQNKRLAIFDPHPKGSTGGTSLLLHLQWTPKLCLCSHCKWGLGLFDISQQVDHQDPGWVKLYNPKKKIMVLPTSQPHQLVPFWGKGQKYLEALH